MKKLILALTIFASSTISAWEGFDYETSSYVEIESGQLVRTGRDIEVYNYSTGEYTEVEVQSMTNYGGKVEVEVYDYDTGEYSTLEMD